MNDCDIIILAAGKGTRMDSDLPKVLIHLGGKPVISHLLESISQLNMSRNPIIVVGHRSEYVKEQLGPTYRYALQENLLGTGHAVKSAREYIDLNSRHILVLYGDMPFITPSTITLLLEAHRASGRVLSMATVTLPDFHDWREGFLKYGRIVRNEFRKIVSVIEYKDASDEVRRCREVNPAYFCIEKEWLWKTLDTLKNNNTQGEYYLTDIVSKAFEEGESITSIEIDPVEALGANTKEQLEILEQFIER